MYEYLSYRVTPIGTRSCSCTRRPLEAAGVAASSASSAGGGGLFSWASSTIKRLPLQLLPSQVSQVLARDRDFATARLRSPPYQRTFCGFVVYARARDHCASSTTTTYNSTTCAADSLMSALLSDLLLGFCGFDGLVLLPVICTR